MSQIPIHTVPDGTQIIDHNGVIWQYNSEEDQWVYRGRVEEPNVVSENNDGIITPDIYRKLVLIQELIEKGYDFSAFKLQTDSGTPYFYYFYSSDDMIQFVPEGQDQLRLELDSGRLYRKLMRFVCVGPKGATGAIGDAGKDGIKADNEVFYKPTISNNNIIIERHVNTPINTPISLRLFNNTTLISEIIQPLDGSTPSITSNDDITINVVNSSFVNNIMKIELNINVDSNSIQYKIRQIGNTGPKGNDGSKFLELENRILDDAALKSTEGVVSLRRFGQNNIAYLNRQVFSSSTVSALAPASTTFPPTKPSKSSFAALEITTKEAKLVGHYDFSAVADELPELDLPQWTPVDGCGQRNRWANFKYNWWDNTDVKYGFNIIPTPKPPDQCCESEFYWCPNVGDEPCGIVGSNNRDPNIKSPKKFAGEHVCGCENPIEFELSAGGYVFAPLDATTEDYNTNGYVASVISSVWDGSVDRFFIDIKISGKTRIECQFTNDPNACGGENIQSADPAYRPITECHISNVIEDMVGNAKWITSTVVETQKLPVSSTFDVDTTLDSDGNNNPTTVRLSMVFNTTGIDNCKAYRLAVIAKKII